MSNLENVAAFTGTSVVSSCGSSCGAADPKLRGFCRGCPAVTYGYTGNMYAPDP